MPLRKYRLYCLDGSGGLKLADWIAAHTDEEAVEKARVIEHGARKVEVWQQDRLVAAMDTEQLSDPIPVQRSYEAVAIKSSREAIARSYETLAQTSLHPAD